MALNIFLQELRAGRKAIIGWLIALVALAAIYMAIYPVFSANTADVQKLLEGFPEPVRKAIGLELDSFGSPLGYYSLVFIYITLCGAIQAMILGVATLSREIREQTADFLMTKPVSRGRIMASKIAAAVAALLLTNVVFLACALLFKQLVAPGGDTLRAFVLISLSLVMTQLVFLAIGIFISAAVKRIRSVLPVSLGTVFGFFIAGMLGAVIGDDRVRYVTPFKYFDYAYIIKNGSYEYAYIIVGAAVAVVAVAAAAVIYKRRDIPSI